MAAVASIGKPNDEPIVTRTAAQIRDDRTHPHWCVRHGVGDFLSKYVGKGNKSRTLACPPTRAMQSTPRLGVTTADTACLFFNPLRFQVGPGSRRRDLSKSGNHAAGI
jgi:hypothetical protein